MKRINWKIVLSNLRESKEELESLISQLESKPISEEALQVKIEHALHHLYFGWNAKFATTKDYRKMGRANFNKWSKVPGDLWIANIGAPNKNRAK